MNRGSKQKQTMQISPGWRSTWIVLGVVLALRLIHFMSALHSPLSFQLSPDEDYYLKFAHAIAAGGGSKVEFAFLDPAYGYILAIILKLFGPYVFTVYIFQTVLDTLTAFCLILIGRELGRPRAGLLGGLIYGLTVTALLFCTTLLKTIWVANFMAVWVLAAFVLLRQPKYYCWLLFGMLCGYGIALRSTLLLMAGLSLLLLPWLNMRHSRRSLAETARATAILIAGMLIPLAFLAGRNYHASGVFSPMSNNSGVVLHMHFNPDNPSGSLWIPPFVSYFHPLDIQRGYTAEARRRLGRTLNPREVDKYWRSQAIDYVRSHPFKAIRSVIDKFGDFVAYPEIPNNRSLADERLFSRILRILPTPFGWLLALGTPGLILLLLRDRRAWLLVAPIATVIVTVSVFAPIDRYRFQAVPIFALCAGLFLDSLIEYVKQNKTRQAAILLTAAAALGGTSALLADPSKLPPARLDKAVWGYLNTGNTGAAKKFALKAAVEQPGNYRIQQALAYIAANEGDLAASANYYRRAIELKPDSHQAHYRFALLLKKMGMHDQAVAHAREAVRIAAQPEYRDLLQELATGK